MGFIEGCSLSSVEDFVITVGLLNYVMYIYSKFHLSKENQRGIHVPILRISPRQKVNKKMTLFFFNLHLQNSLITGCYQVNIHKKLVNTNSFLF